MLSCQALRRSAQVVSPPISWVAAARRNLGTIINSGNPTRGDYFFETMIPLLHRLCLRCSLKIASQIKRYSTMTPVPIAEIVEELTRKYRPYLLPSERAEKDWISELELDTVEHFEGESTEGRGTFEDSGVLWVVKGEVCLSVV